MLVPALSVENTEAMLLLVENEKNPELEVDDVLLSPVDLAADGDADADPIP